MSLNLALCLTNRVNKCISNASANYYGNKAIDLGLKGLLSITYRCYKQKYISIYHSRSFPRLKCDCYQPEIFNLNIYRSFLRQTHLGRWSYYTQLKQKPVQGLPIKNGQSWAELYCFKDILHLDLTGS